MLIADSQVHVCRPNALRQPWPAPVNAQPNSPLRAVGVIERL